MDNSHVALVAVKLEASGFKRYRCDRSIPLGVNLGSLTKVLKCAKDDDICTLKAGDDADILSLTYEAKSTYRRTRSLKTKLTRTIDSDRIAEYEMKLMDIDADTLGIPETEYDASVTMPSTEFGRIVRDLSLLGESVRIEVSKEGIRFVSDGEAANGNILLKQSAEASKKKGSSSKRKDDEDEDDEPEDEEDAASDGDGGKKKIKKEKKVKKENGEDVEMNGVDEDEEGEQEFKPTKGEDDDEEQEDDEEEGSSKKRKRSSGKVRVIVLDCNDTGLPLDRRSLRRK